MSEPSVSVSKVPCFRWDLPKVPKSNLFQAPLLHVIFFSFLWNLFIAWLYLSLTGPEETDSEAEGMWEEVDRGFHQPSETPWHTYLELHRLLQTFHLEAGHQGKPKGYLVEPEARFPPEGDTDCLKNNQKTQQEMKTPEEARCQSQEGCAPLQVAGSSVHCLSSTKNLRSGKAAYYPFPQRKPPRISQAARNLGLYGPP